MGSFAGRINHQTNTADTSSQSFLAFPPPCPNTQLAGFSKSKDLAFFLAVLLKAGYEHRIDLAPTAELLKDYKDGKTNWATYEKTYIDLLNARHIQLTPNMDGSCFLCAEDKPNQCRRRLLMEYLAAQGAGVKIVHL